MKPLIATMHSHWKFIVKISDSSPLPILYSHPKGHVKCWGKQLFQEWTKLTIQNKKAGGYVSALHPPNGTQQDTGCSAEWMEQRWTSGTQQLSFQQEQAIFVGTMILKNTTTTTPEADCLTATALQPRAVESGGSGKESKHPTFGSFAPILPTLFGLCCTKNLFSNEDCCSTIGDGSTPLAELAFQGNVNGYCCFLSSLLASGIGQSCTLGRVRV